MGRANDILLQVEMHGALSKEEICSRSTNDILIQLDKYVPDSAISSATLLASPSTSS